MSARRSAVPVLRPRVAARALAADPHLGPWVRRVGAVRLPKVTDPPYAYLARAIIYQQLAGKAAATIHGRFVEALGGAVEPGAVARVDDATLRAAGLSRGKLAALRDLTDKAAGLELEGLHRIDDDEVVARLTTVRGIGPWTAHMFLMFYLRRPDVWPVGDLGVRMGYARVHGLAEPPTAKELEPLGEAYRPWRSAAAWYMWRVLEVKGDSE